MYPLGIDISVWDDENSTPQMFNFNKAKQEGATFVYIKASQSTWIDQDYVLNWDFARRSGLPYGAYHYLTWDADPVRQMDFFWGLLKKNPGTLPIVIDYECRTAVPIRQVAVNALKAACEHLKYLSGKPPMIYTGPGYWNEFGTTDVYWKQYPLWEANYGRVTPTVMAPWNTWLFWQWTDKMDGIKFGGEAKELDGNYFNGTLEDLGKLVGAPIPELTVPLAVWAKNVDAFLREKNGFTGPKLGE